MIEVNRYRIHHQRFARDQFNLESGFNLNALKGLFRRLRRICRLINPMSPASLLFDRIHKIRARRVLKQQTDKKHYRHR